MALNANVARVVGLLLVLGLIHQIYPFLPSGSPILPNRVLDFPNPFSHLNQGLLPWYKRPHGRIGAPAFDTEYSWTTEHLSDQERTELQDRMVRVAGAVARDRFGDAYENMIPGSRLSNTSVASFRERLDCWTRRGRWVRRRTPLLPHFQDPLYGRCDRKQGTDRDAVQYAWTTPPECPLMPIDAGQWCGAVGGRKLLLVGDLVHYQVHELLLDALRDGPTVCYGELNCKDHTFCTDHTDPPPALRYLRNDVLATNLNIDKAHGHPSVDIVQWPFVPRYLLEDYHIFILNRAPVVEDDSTFLRQLAQTLHTLRRIQPNALILYRSTSIGHPFCDEASGPLDAPLTDAQLRQLPYGWSEQTRRNAMARAVVEAAGGVYVDLAALTDLRPDGHVGGQDCLRYCMPGPLDGWASVLYNVMLSLGKNS